MRTCPAKSGVLLQTSRRPDVALSGQERASSKNFTVPALFFVNSLYILVSYRYFPPQGELPVLPDPEFGPARQRQGSASGRKPHEF